MGTLPRSRVQGRRQRGRGRLRLPENRSSCSPTGRCIREARPPAQIPRSTTFVEDVGLLSQLPFKSDDVKSNVRVPIPMLPVHVAVTVSVRLPRPPILRNTRLTTPFRPVEAVCGLHPAQTQNASVVPPEDCSVAFVAHEATGTSRHREE